MSVISSGGWNTTDDHAVEGSSPDAADGTGGGDMSFWFQPRLDRMQALQSYNSLLKWSGVDESRFEVGSVIIGQGGWDNSYRNEALNGSGVKGFVTDVDGKDIPGTAEIKDSSGDTISSINALIDILITADAPTAVTDGATLETEQLELQFTPNEKAIPYQKAGVEYGISPSIQFARVEGSVFDVNGTVISGDVIVGNDSVEIFTDDTGYYSVKAPGGVSVNLEAIDGTLTKSTSVAGGSSGTVDFYYGGADIKVLDPKGRSVSDVPVEVAGSSKRTSDGGSAQFEQVPLRGYDVYIQGVDSKVNVNPNEGTFDNKDISAGKMAKYEVVNAVTRDKIQNIPIVESNTGASTATGPNGTGSVLVIDAGVDMVMIVGQGDSRFTSLRIDESVKEGEIVEKVVEVGTKVNVSTRI